MRIPGLLLWVPRGRAYVHPGKRRRYNYRWCIIVQGTLTFDTTAPVRFNVGRFHPGGGEILGDVSVRYRRRV